jgi:hypothetical protein
MRKSIPSDPVRPPPCPAAAQPLRQARPPSLAERVAALDRLTAWPTLRLRCALRQPA